MKNPGSIYRRLAGTSILVAILAAGAALATAPGWGEEVPARDSRGFAIARPGYEFEFPRDHGSHPDFAIEWWYLTGHLEVDGDGGDSSPRRFGYQVTFFRLAQEPPGANTPGDGDSAFRHDTLHLAHVALSDPESGEFHEEERLNRDGWDALATVGDLHLRNGNWRLERIGENTFNLVATVRAEVQFSLTLVAEKPPVLFGDQGLSQKSNDPTAASYYITFTRLATSGTLRVNGRNLPVSGSSWMDHEISSSQLGPDQVGWDWVSIQFDDGREVMAYVLRREDGSYDPISKLSWIDVSGQVSAVALGEFEWAPGGAWISPTTSATYPIAPTIQTVDPASGETRNFRLRPLMEAQEVDGKVTGMAYWEGACDVLDDTGEVVGRAYLELAGYTPGLRERLRAP